jgi:hypothetical protein
MIAEVAETFGMRLRSHRKSIIDPETTRPLSRVRAAERAGVCFNTWRNWERDKTLPLGSHRRELARVFPGVFSHQ